MDSLRKRLEKELFKALSPNKKRRLENSKNTLATLRVSKEPNEGDKLMCISRGT